MSSYNLVPQAPQQQDEKCVFTSTHVSIKKIGVPGDVYGGLKILDHRGVVGCLGVRALCRLGRVLSRDDAGMGEVVGAGEFIMKCGLLVHGFAGFVCGVFLAMEAGEEVWVRKVEAGDVRVFVTAK